MTQNDASLAFASMFWKLTFSTSSLQTKQAEGEFACEVIRISQIVRQASKSEALRAKSATRERITASSSFSPCGCNDPKSLMSLMIFRTFL